jgi:uncharacterized protein (DUF305 family)
MKLNIFRIVMLPAAVAAAIAFAGCSADDSMSGMAHNSASPTASSSATAVGEFNEADVMFVQMMIPHHEQAVDMSDMVLSKSGLNPEVEALAKQIKAAQQPEIDMMNAWLETWGRIPMPEGSHHSTSDGMMSEEQMQELDEANSADGQRLFLEGMIRHHQGAIKMAQAEIASGKNPDAIMLAKNIAESQQAEVDTMTELLNKI